MYYLDVISRLKTVYIINMEAANCEFAVLRRSQAATAAFDGHNIKALLHLNIPLTAFL